MSEQRLPPVTELGVVSMALVIAGGIWIASHMPVDVPLAPAIVLLAASVVVMVANIVALSRVPHFNRPLFFGVAKHALLAYCVIAGILEFVFIHDGTRGGVLVVLTLSLVVFAIHVPLLVGFTVARFAPLRPAGQG
jgi:hypothetical protein